jgi:hypothetical protein
LDADAKVLLRLAGRMQAFHPQMSLLELVQAPSAHPDVARAVLAFARFAADQYQDAVALLAALSTNLTNTSELYRDVDAQHAARLEKFLKDSRLVPFYERGL